MGVIWGAVSLKGNKYRVLLWAGYMVVVDWVYIKRKGVGLWTRIRLWFVDPVVYILGLVVL